MIEPVEVTGLSPTMRIFTVAVWLASGALFYWLAFAHPTQGHWFGYGMAGVALWSALYWMRMPTVLARADDTGITYADLRYGLVLMFGEAHAAWSDVLAVDTREIASRYGTYLRTRVTVRDEGGTGTRHFTLTSKAGGYVRFLDALRAHTAAAGVTVEEKGLGDDPERARTELRKISAGRIRALKVILLIGVLLMLYMFYFRRH
jgi:hypothetical protein